ncbi:class IV lanthionine synthetase LanL [Streptomyces sp. B6B3]|uniref:class IV lanthionine synthetase LanL n=1 Tax=Streptomyces sp. B6B3 TaxID=3153570 RepID=UPI00325CE13F
MNLPSVFGTWRRDSGPPSLDDDSDLMTVLRRKLTECDAESAAVSFDAMWCHVRPKGAQHPDQGWKLHVSATAEAAPGTLERVVDVLLRACCAFKFASTLDRLRTLNAAHYPRAGAGKFVTVYPSDDAEFTRLAGLLHEATLGRAGPAVLSDRPFAERSVVHYRYGGFSPARVLTNDGEYVGALSVAESSAESAESAESAASGHLVPDERNPWFSPPSWARDPLERRTGPATTDAARPATGRGAAEVLLGGRFVATAAIRQSNRGGVYQASDRRTGHDVVVKQARRHVLGNSGTDAQAALRHEARVLGELRPLGHTPAVLALFEQGDDLFLAQQRMAGVVLRRWVRERAGSIGRTTRAEPGVPLGEARAVLARLVALLRDVHATGWVLRDLSPNNVLVEPDGIPRLVDLEFAGRSGGTGPPGGTPGYAAPEQLAAGHVSREADLFSLGGIAFMLVTGVDPVFPPDAPVARTDADKRAAWLTEAARHGAAAAALAALVTGLTATEPGRRWTLDRAEAFLGETAATPPTRAAQPARPARPAQPAPVAAHRHQDAEPARWSDALADRLLADGLAHLCAEFDPANPATQGLWPRACSTGSTDPANVQHGAAGVLSVLVRAHGRVPEPRLTEVIASATGWLRRHVRTERTVLPGLYFGRSGTAWAMFEAAELLGDARLADDAVALALRTPLRWGNPDVAHGVAGNGLAQLHLWRRTGDAAFATRYLACAEELADRAVRSGGAVHWPIPADLDSRLAGLTHLGFAHGSAGIAAFLLEAGLDGGREDWLALAAETSRYLVSVAVGDTPEAALWPTSADEDNPMEHWCSGSTGVGRLLLRHWEVSGDAAALDLAARAGEAAYRRRWQAAPVQCHGLAGNGEYLLDLAAATGDARHRRAAEEVAWTASLRSATRAGRTVTPDETMAGFGAEYGVGLAGQLDFLLRLRHGLDRQWSVPIDSPRRKERT